MIGKIDPVFLSAADLSGREKMLEYIQHRHGALNELLVARSILSRPIYCYRIGETESCVLIVAAHHALESITTNLAFMLIDYILGNSENGNIKGMDCKLLLSKFRFMILPCLNPDGVELRFHGASESPLYERQMRMSDGDFSCWQANARGVDLNHNYEFGFAEYKAIEREKHILPGATLYSGEYPESEPETRGLANLVRTLMPRAVVSLHTQGEEIFYRPRVQRSARIAERLASLTGYSVSIPEGTAAYGGLADYSGSLGIPSFTIEVGKGVNPLSEEDAPLIHQRIADPLFMLPTLL